jgi:UDP-2,4-diacetamido-2,4,6-trideoxy-beta-L-altropyranose hydrolase
MLMRCDGGPRLGMGHGVRCLALAAALRQAGTACTFATWDHADGIAGRIRQAGFEVVAVGKPVDSDQPLGPGDRAATLQAARHCAAGVVLVDHYQADAAYLAGLADADCRVAVIDDLADRDLASADWVLNQNPGAFGLDYRVRDDTVVLRGLDYALLRPEFAQARGRMHRTHGTEDANVLITLGGSDVAAQTAALVDGLDALPRRLVVRCILAGTAELARVEQATARSPHAVTILHDVADMAGQMAWADVSISAGGSTCWELCCMGVAMIVLQLSRDQAGNLPVLAEEGLAVAVGAWDSQRTPPTVASVVADLLAHPRRRAERARRGQARVDGRGAKRAADSLMALSAVGARVTQ